MKNKLSVFIICLMLLASHSKAQNATVPKPAIAPLLAENNNAKPSGTGIVSQTEKNIKPGAVGFQKSDAAQTKVIEVNAESNKGLKTINRDRPRSDTFRAVPQKPVTTQEQNAEPSKATAIPKGL